MNHLFCTLIREENKDCLTSKSPVFSSHVKQVAFKMPTLPSNLDRKRKKKSRALVKLQKKKVNKWINCTKKLILGNLLEHFRSIKNSSISQVNILADLSEHTGCKICQIFLKWCGLLLINTDNPPPPVRFVWLKHERWTNPAQVKPQQQQKKKNYCTCSRHDITPRLLSAANMRGRFINRAPLFWRKTTKVELAGGVWSFP